VFLPGPTVTTSFVAGIGQLAALCVPSVWAVEVEPTGFAAVRPPCISSATITQLPESLPAGGTVSPDPIPKSDSYGVTIGALGVIAVCVAPQP
jgi:hypothetical protein